MTTTNVLFLQPFRIDANGGGSRIMRTALRFAPKGCSPTVLVTSPGAVDNPAAREIACRLRPAFGMMEFGRKARLLAYLKWIWKPFFIRNFRHCIRRLQPDVIHVIPHRDDDWRWVLADLVRPGHRLAISVHDDLRYEHGRKKKWAAINRDLGVLWQRADVRYVISQELGEEYQRRYGLGNFIVHTDGLMESEIAPARSGYRPRGCLTGYFMGLLHFAYGDNFRCLQRALLAQVEVEQDRSHLVLRGGSLPRQMQVKGCRTETKPFVSDFPLTDEFAGVDFLYLPLPFAEKAVDFVRFSLSTKFISYLGAGVPIVYHGPRESALANLIERTRVGVCCYDLQPRALLAEIKRAREKRDSLLVNAKLLLAERFTARVVSERFWFNLL